MNILYVDESSQKGTVLSKKNGSLWRTARIAKERLTNLNHLVIRQPAEATSRVLGTGSPLPLGNRQARPPARLSHSDGDCSSRTGRRNSC